MFKLKSKLIENGFEKKNNMKKVEIGEGNDKGFYLMEFYYEHSTDLNAVSWHKGIKNCRLTTYIEIFKPTSALNIKSR